MDLRQLNALLAVANHGSFSAAARSLFTVQSNVSTHIQRLERELGARLIDRTRNELTEEGELVAARARRIQAELDAIPGELSAFKGALAGQVRLGLIGTTARWLAPLLFKAVSVEHPALRIVIIEASTTSLLPQVVDGRLELAIVNLPADAPEVETELLFEEDLIVIAPGGHPLTERAAVSIIDLAEFEILLPPVGTALRDELDEQARRAQVRLRASAEIDGGRLLASLAMEGHGIAVVPATAIPGWLKGDFVRVPVTGLSRRQVGLVRRSRSTLSAPARAVVAELHRVLRRQELRQQGLYITVPDAPAAASR